MNQTLTRHTSTTVAAPVRTSDTVRRTAGHGAPARRRATTDGLRPDVRRPAGRRPEVVRPRTGAACGDARRQAPPSLRPAPIGWAVAVVVGIGLAVVMWMMVVSGSVFADSTAPAVSGTELVHVRGGESLGELAGRVAPDQPMSSVVATIKDLNHLSGSAITAGQPLLAPTYLR